MIKKFKHKIKITLIILVPIIFGLLIISPFIKHMYLEVHYADYNPYEEYSEDFNELAKKMLEIQPINKLEIEGRYSISINKSKGDNYKINDLKLSNGKNIYDVMNMVGIKYISHWEDSLISLKTEKWLLGNQGNEYMYFKIGYKNDNELDEKKIVKILNENWIIYNYYK